jgi:hypothetical protein
MDVNKDGDKARNTDAGGQPIHASSSSTAPIDAEQVEFNKCWMVTIMRTVAVQRDMKMPGFLYRLLYPLTTDVYQVGSCVVHCYSCVHTQRYYICTACG